LMPPLPLLLHLAGFPRAVDPGKVSIHLLVGSGLLLGLRIRWFLVILYGSGKFFAVLLAGERCSFLSFFFFFFQTSFSLSPAQLPASQVWRCELPQDPAGRLPFPFSLRSFRFICFLRSFSPATIMATPEAAFLPLF